MRHNYGNNVPVYEPSPQEIERKLQEIQQTWTEKQRQAREVQQQTIPAELVVLPDPQAEMRRGR